MNTVEVTSTFQTHDIGESLSYILNLFANLFGNCFQFLQSIEFWGINLLTFIISILVLSALLPIIFSFISSPPKIGGSSKRYNPNAKSDPYKGDS